MSLSGFSQQSFGKMVNNMRVNFGLGLFCLAVIVVALLFAELPPGEPDVRSGGGGAVEGDGSASVAGNESLGYPVRVAHMVSPSASEWYPMYRSELFTFGCGVDPMEKEVRLGRSERVIDATLIEGWRSEDALRRFSVSYKPLVANMTDSRRVYVAGVTDAGVVVVELWSVPTEIGAYQVVRGEGGALGVPTPTADVVFSTRGASYLPPSARQVIPPRRQLLHRGPEMAGVRALAPDPEGRYVLLIDEQRRLWMLDVSDPTSSSVLTLLLEPSTTPFMLGVESLRVRHHRHSGRKVILSRGLYPDLPVAIGVLTDLANDGTFESFEVLSEQQAIATQHWHNDWLDDFASKKFFVADPRF